MYNRSQTQAWIPARWRRQRREKEMAMLIRFTKVNPVVLSLMLSVSGIMQAQTFQSSTRTVGSLPWHHRDPFDRMLIAQAMVEKLVLITADPQLGAYDPQLGAYRRLRPDGSLIGVFLKTQRGVFRNTNHFTSIG
jgi:hypothetical protein